MKYPTFMILTIVTIGKNSKEGMRRESEREKKEMDGILY